MGMAIEGIGASLYIILRFVEETAQTKIGGAVLIILASLFLTVALGFIAYVVYEAWSDEGDFYG